MRYVKTLILCLVFLSVYASALFAIDTKYFCAFSYRQKAVWGSDYSLTPEFRFDESMQRFYYYHWRTGFLFHPFSWLDLGLYYRFVNQRTNGEWQPENRFEFHFDPKIILQFVPLMPRVGRGTEEAEDTSIVGRVRQGALRVLEIIMINDFEFWNIDLQKPENTHVVYRIRPRVSWGYDFGTVYVSDDLFHSLKHGKIFRNWATVGVVKPLNGLSLDLYYTYESERTRFLSTLSDDWENAHVFGTRLIWNRD
jgi:hypothetical protein